MLQSPNRQSVENTLEINQTLGKSGDVSKNEYKKDTAKPV